MKTEKFRKSENVVDRRPLGDRFTTFPVGDVAQKVEYQDVDLGRNAPTKEGLKRTLTAKQKFMDEDAVLEGPTKKNAEFKFSKPSFPQGDKEVKPPSADEMRQYEEEGESVAEQMKKRLFAKGGLVNKGYRKLKG